MLTVDPEAIEVLPASESARSERGFWALIATQFQGAYSDNILRNLLLAMIVGMGLGKEERDTFVSIVTFLFSVPFVLFSMTGGWLADHFSKRQVTIWTKVMEIGAMTIATAGLAMHEQALYAGGAHWGWSPRRPRSSGPPSTDCCRNCFPPSAFPGATASSNSAHSSPSSSVP